MVPRAKRLTPAQVLGARVRALRENLGDRQLDLARRAKKHATYISRLEAGKINPSLNALVDIAVALDVDPATLVADIHPRDLRSHRRPKRPPSDEIAP